MGTFEKLSGLDRSFLALESASAHMHIGATLVFASSVTAFISQSVIGGGRLVFLPSVIWQQSMVVYNWPFAAVAAVTLLVTVLTGIGLLAALSVRLARR